MKSAGVENFHRGMKRNGGLQKIKIYLDTQIFGCYYYYISKMFDCLYCLSKEQLHVYNFRSNVFRIQ